MAGMSDTVPLNSFDSTTTMNSRAPLTSTSSLDYQIRNFPASHDYESPLELQRELEKERGRIRQEGHRKKQCLLYEPTNVSDRKYPDEDSDGVRYVHAHDKLYRVIFIVLFLFFLISLCLSVMALLGVHLRQPVCACGTSTDTSASAPKTAHSRASENSVITAAVENNVMQIQRNFSYLYSVVIPMLHAELKELRNKAEVKVDVSKMVGPPGAQGPVGPPGPPGPSGPSGVANLTQCSHKSSTITSQISTQGSDGPKRAVAVTERISATKDKVFTGVTCSAIGASEYSLISSLSDNGVETLFCRCGGRADSYALLSSDDNIHCTIHWWECPSIS